MTKRSIANVFALRDDDPRFIGQVSRVLAERFPHVWQPAEGWVVASEPVGLSEPDPAEARAGGLAFVEGIDRVSDGTRARFEEVAALTDKAPEMLAQVPGDFAFLRIRKDGGATAVRACVGTAPIYYRTHGRRIVVGSRLSDLVGFGERSDELDHLVNGMWAAHVMLFPDNRSFLRDVYVLPSGHAAVWGPTGGQTRLIRYWNPQPTEWPITDLAALTEHGAALRETLLSALDRDLEDDGNLLAFSGGVDSSSLAALIAGTLGRPLHTITIYPGRPDLMTRERSYTTPIIERYGIDAHEEVVGVGSRRKLMRGLPPVLTHPADPTIGALPSVMQSAPVRVMFTGEFADEIGGTQFALTDWIRATSPLGLVRSLRRLPNGKKDLLRWGLIHMRDAIGKPKMALMRDLDDVVARPINDEYREWWEREQRRVAGMPKPLRYLRQRLEVYGTTQMQWEVCVSLGVRRAPPFLTREVVELGFQCHPAERIGPGFKRLIREAFRHDVPAHNLDRPDKGIWTNFLWDAEEPWEGELPPEIGPIVRPDLYPKPPSQMAYKQAFRLEQLVLICSALKGIQASMRGDPPMRVHQHDREM